jgi:clan AA aspartic protease
MMTGLVNADLEACLRLLVRDNGGQSLPIDTVIDTGFNGFLTLPTAVISALGLPFLCRQQGQLADGTLHVFDVHVATVEWDGAQRAIEVEAVDAQPLVGVSLMQGFDLHVRVRPGDAVGITAIP